MRALAVGTIGALACLGPFAAPPARAALPSAGGCEADAELIIGATGSDVICLQFALGMLHISSQPITGTYDQATADAVSWFQATHAPLRIDGRAGPRTLAALGIWSGIINNVEGTESVPGEPCRADATIDPDDAGESVICLQDALRELGLYDGPSSGLADPPTVEAIKAFQRDTPPLDVDGRAGPRTLAAMSIWSGNAGAGGAASAGTGGFAPPGPWPAPLLGEPNWLLTADGLPVYGKHTACSRADADMIAYQFALDGADVATQQWAVYIATREGGCRFDAVNINIDTQDDSHCSFQLNALAGLFAPGASLGRLGWTVENVKASMANCANAASDLWVFCGRGPWTPPYSCRPPWGDGLASAAVSSPVPFIPPDGDA